MTLSRIAFFLKNMHSECDRRDGYRTFQTRILECVEADADSSILRV